MKKVIEIQVRGPVGSGKTEVLAVIKSALIEHYGSHTQVASYELSAEGPDVLVTARKTGQTCSESDTVFVLSETQYKAFMRVGLDP